MSAVQLGQLTASTLVCLVVAMIVIVACSRVSARRQCIAYTIAYLLALFIVFVGADSNKDIPTLSSIIVLALVIWSYRRKMRKTASGTVSNATS